MPDPVAGVPDAPRRPYRREHHGDVFVDPYEWLRDKADPEVTAYLEAENAYTAAQMKPTAALQETLYREMVGPRGEAR